MIIAILLLVFVSLVVISLLNYFTNLSKAPIYVSLIAFLAWVFPFCIIIILPLDLSSTLFRKCSSSPASDIICDLPLGYVDDQFLLVFWKTLYWTMFNLTWFVIPILQSWIRSGEFSIRKKIYAVIRENIIYYLTLGAIGLVFLIYIFIALGFDMYFYN